MNSGDPLRSDGLAPVIGGPFGWFKKLASGVIPKSFTIPKCNKKLVSTSLTNKHLSKYYQVRWRKAFQGVLGRNVNRAGGRAVHHTQSQTYHWRSRGIQPHRDHQAISSLEIRAFLIRHKTAHDPCSWVVSVGAPLISCSGTRPMEDNKRIFKYFSSDYNFPRFSDFNFSSTEQWRTTSFYFILHRVWTNPKESTAEAWKNQSAIDFKAGSDSLGIASLQ